MNNREPTKYVILSSEKELRTFCNDVKQLAKEICYSERIQKENNYFLPIKTFQQRIVILKENKQKQQAISKVPSYLSLNLSQKCHNYRSRQISKIIVNLIKSKLKCGFLSIFSKAISNCRIIRRKNQNKTSFKKMLSQKKFHQPKNMKQIKTSKKTKSLTSTGNFERIKSPLKAKETNINLQKQRKKQSIYKSTSNKKVKSISKNHYFTNRQNHQNNHTYTK